MEKEFERVVSEFLVPLRMREKIDETKYFALCEALRKLKNELSGNANISKSLSLILVDIYPQMQGIASLYRGTEAEKIQDWAEDLLDLIHEVVI